VEILGREVPILFRDETGAVVTGFADLVYRHEGRVHVADYKTDEIGGEEAAGTYRSQLADYGEAIRRALGPEEPPRLEILFLRTGERIPL
jgi:ATP-dependent exoDNAse (exonuclease V) beta subunit